MHLRPHAGLKVQEASKRNPIANLNTYLACELLHALAKSIKDLIMERTISHQNARACCGCERHTRLKLWVVGSTIPIKSICPRMVKYILPIWVAARFMIQATQHWMYLDKTDRKQKCISRLDKFHSSLLIQEHRVQMWPFQIQWNNSKNRTITMPCNQVLWQPTLLLQGIIIIHPSATAQEFPWHIFWYQTNKNSKCPSIILPSVQQALIFVQVTYP